ncbi:hypothetical protein BKA70DRAFT_1403221 [Coprinopsis sp. MPI-PUGE-AT-0042]|nr:hypothetical protein BKA70DRAFT_1403221 [Coprinopsis sp. MPI-PUGE-AT-0042]
MAEEAREIVGAGQEQKAILTAIAGTRWVTITKLHQPHPTERVEDRRRQAWLNAHRRPPRWRRGRAGKRSCRRDDVMQRLPMIFIVKESRANETLLLLRFSWFDGSIGFGVYGRKCTDSLLPWGAVQYLCASFSYRLRKGAVGGREKRRHGYIQGLPIPHLQKLLQKGGRKTKEGQRRGNEERRRGQTHVVAGTFPAGKPLIVLNAGRSYVPEQYTFRVWGEVAAGVSDGGFEKGDVVAYLEGRSARALSRPDRRAEV